MQLPSKRQIVQRMEAEKKELADLKKGVAFVDPDQESLQRLRALRGEIDQPMKAAPPMRTAQVLPFWKIWPRDLLQDPRMAPISWLS